MIAMKKEPGKDPVVISMENTLAGIYAAIGGDCDCFEHVGLGLFDSEDGKQVRIGILLDESGKLKGLKPNFLFYGDIIVGSVVFVAEDGEDFTDLSEGHQRMIMERFSAS